MLSSIELRVLEMNIYSSSNSFSSLLLILVFLSRPAFVVWAKSELKHFVSRFSNQVFRREMGLAATGVCVSMARHQCEKVNLTVFSRLTLLLKAARYIAIVNDVCLSFSWYILLLFSLRCSASCPESLLIFISSDP